MAKRTTMVLAALKGRDVLLNRATTVVLASLVATLVIFHGPRQPIARASGLHGQSVPLESLPMSNSNGPAPLSASSPGHYRGMPITHGLRMDCRGHADFFLGGKYTALTGTVYASDDFGSGTGNVTIYDSSDASHKKLIFDSGHLSITQKASFHESVRGVQYLTVQASGNCSWGQTFIIVATVTAAAISPKPANQVIPRYPTNGAGVSVDSKVLFGWQPFPHATNYAFHIWLVGLSGSASLTSTTPFSFSASIYHKTSYTWDDHGFLPGTYQYALLPLDDQGHNLAGWSTPTQITIAS